MSPRRHPTRDESLAWWRSHKLRDHGNGGALRQTTRGGDRRPRAALDRTVELLQPQTAECPVPVLQEMVQEIVHEDDHEEETLQSDAETAMKVTINDTYTLPSVVTTGKTQRFHPDH